MAHHSGGIITESYAHHFREGGYRVDIARAPEREKGGTVITLQGGLTDNLSRSMGTSEHDIENRRGLAFALIEASEGEIIVASVATMRPGSLPRRLVGSFRPRTHRSKANAGAAKYLDNRFQPETLIMGGQSLGGISAVDGALWHANPEPTNRKPSNTGVDGVVTIDTPGIYGPLKFDGPLLEGLGVLAKNCLSDMGHLSIRDKARFFGPHVLNIATPLEYAFVMNEIGFSKEADFSGEVSQLRRFGVAVSHIFHAEDCIPGAEVESPHSVVFSGGHARFMYEPEPVAEHIIRFAAGLREAPVMSLEDYRPVSLASAGY